MKKIEKLSERTPSLAKRGQYEHQFKTEQAKLRKKNKQLIATTKTEKNKQN